MTLFILCLLICSLFCSLLWATDGVCYGQIRTFKEAERGFLLPSLVRAFLVVSAVSYSLRPHGLWPARVLCAWDSPGKNTGVGIFPTQGLNSPLLPASPAWAGRFFTPSDIWDCRSVQLLSHVRLSATPWTAAHQASLSITNSQSLLKLCPLSR